MAFRSELNRRKLGVLRAKVRAYRAAGVHVYHVKEQAVAKKHLSEIQIQQSTQEKVAGCFLIIILLPFLGFISGAAFFFFVKAFEILKWI